MGSHAHKKSCLNVLYNNLSFDHLSPGSGAGKAISRNIVLSSAGYFLASPAKDCLETLKLPLCAAITLRLQFRHHLAVSHSHPSLLQTPPCPSEQQLLSLQATERGIVLLQMPTTSFRAQLMSL